MKVSEISRLRIYNFTLLLVAFSLPFPIKTHASGYAVIALALAWIYLGEWKAKWVQLKESRVPFLFFGFYLLILIGYFLSENKSEAKFLIEKNFSMLALPLIIISGPKIKETTILLAAKVFIFACLGISLYSLGSALYLYFYKNEMHFYYKSLEELLNVHSTYFSLYLSFSVLLIAGHTYYNWKRLHFTSIITRFFISLFLIYFMYQLAARMPFFSLIILLSILALYFFYKKKKLWIGILLISAIVLSTIYGLSTLYHTYLRFYYAIYPESWEWKGAQTRNEWLNRKVLWGCNLEAIKSSNPVWGTGTGDSWQSVMPCYKRWDYLGYSERYNAHNQYIEIMLRMGIIGLSVWLAGLLIPLWLSFKRKHVYYFLFLILFIMGCLTENLIDRQHGVVFYSFFNAVFWSFYFIKGNSP